MRSGTRFYFAGMAILALSLLPSSGPKAEVVEGWVGPTPPTDLDLSSSNASARGRAAALFSWKTFAALQWPAKKGRRGEPGSWRDNRDSPRVWETWKEPYEVYLPDGKRPVDWEVEAPLPGLEVPLDHKTLIRRTKVSDLLNEKVQATQADGTLPPVLTDQSGKLVRYEIRMNRVVFDHIRQKQLYDGAVQATTDKVSYPDGACLLKAAWKELKPEEEGRYIAADCWILENGTRRLQRMGLVGLHIMVKTPSAPQWVWATFEQIDNLEGTHPSFCDPSKGGLEVNVQGVEGVPTQVSRVVPIPAWLRSLNREIQARLAKQDSRLAYYELVETQRPVLGSQPKGAPATAFRVEPALLSNTTQETFIQTSSCMGCHAMAGTLSERNFVSGDFTFTLNEAWPKPRRAGIISPPARPQTDWEVEHWAQIQRGQQLAEHTYELLPEKVGARLHCASCHLQSGGNPQASWWVGMTKAYEYPATDRLQQRINRCFTHSMNGQALTKPGQSNPDMEALITYMRWLDSQVPASQTQAGVRGFPNITELSGDSQRGQQVYQQKCNFCHGSDGGGRYLSNQYFRPALWGAHSWPKRAGLGKHKTLAAFLKANMPLGSGGMLTDQEAWDLAVFLNGQNRP